MDNTIKVGSVVFHALAGGYKGPGTVTAIETDKDFGVDIFTVYWQSEGVTGDHLRRNLRTLAEWESGK